MLPRLFNFLMAFLLPLVLVEIDYQEEKSVLHVNYSHHFVVLQCHRTTPFHK